MVQFIDLVVEGIRRFAKSQKIAFKPGFNLIYGSNESGKSTLVEVILELLFPDRFREEETSLMNWLSSESSRAGLTISQEKETYRILKDFRTNKIALSRLNAETQKYETMSDEATKISSILADVFNLPAFETYRNLFVNQPDSLPSVLPMEAPIERPQQPAQASQPGQAQAPSQGFPGAMPGPQGPMGFGYQQPGYPGFGAPGTMPPGTMYPGMSGPGMVPPGMMPPGMMPPGMMPPGMMPPGMSMPGMMEYEQVSEEEIKDKEKNLEQLKEEYEKARELEDFQFEVDGLQAKIFEIESKRKNVDKIDAAINQANEILSSYALFRNLPENIDERLERYNHLTEMQAREIESMDDKARFIDEDLYSLQQKPLFYKTSLFNLGIVLCVAGLLSIFLKNYIELLKIVAFALLPGVGIIGYLIWQHLSLQGQIEEVKKRVQEFETQRQNIIKKFEVEGAVIKKLFEQADTESTDALKEKIEKYKQTEQKAKNLERRKREMMIELDWDNLKKEESDLREKIVNLEEKIRSYPPLSMEPNEMKREIKELEEFLEKVKPRSQSAGTSVPDLSSPGAPAPQPESRPSDPGSTRMSEDVPASLLAGTSAAGAYQRMLAAAGTLLGVERVKLVEHISSRFQLYLQALTNKRYQKAEFETDGSIRLVTGERGIEARLEQLSPAARDALYFALQFTLLEILVQKNPLPLILDDPYIHLDEVRQQVASQALKRLSEKTQVILLSTQRIHAKMASHSLNLG
jgi:energy-coupling factor transporter ATP-binding protein EcfA2